LRQRGRRGAYYASLNPAWTRLRQERLTLIRDRLEDALVNRDDGGWQRRVEELLGIRPSIMNGPPQEVGQGLALDLVGLLLGDQQIGKPGDGVGCRPSSIGDGHTDVVGLRHLLRTPGRGRGRRRERGGDPLA